MRLKQFHHCPKKKTALNFFYRFINSTPPLSDSDLIKSKKIDQRLERKFKDAFSEINWQKVRIATTPVASFNHKLSKLSIRPLESIPVPLLMDMKNDFHYYSSPTLKIGMLGDSRKEKGLLMFIRSIPLLASQVKVQIIVNIQNPRCFSQDDLAEIRQFLGADQRQYQTEIIEGVLDSNTYYNLLTSCSLIVLPYSPEHYWMRMSGIAIECAILGVPILGSKGTTFGDLIEAKQLSGITFDYLENVEAFSRGLTEALERYQKEEETLINLAKKLKEKYKFDYSAKSYLKSILN